MDYAKPREMPTWVKASYREPMDLLALLSFSERRYRGALPDERNPRIEVYSDQDRKSIRDRLLRALVRRYGMAEVDVGGELKTVDQLVREISDPIEAIGALLNVEEYGGKEETLPMLAIEMDPQWQRWWGEQAWASSLEIFDWERVILSVVGDRQMAWLAAQYTRKLAWIAKGARQELIYRSVEIAEQWALDPSAENKNKARKAEREVSGLQSMGEGPTKRATDAAQSTLLLVGYARKLNALSKVAENVVYAMSMSTGKTSQQWSLELCEMTKELFSPTLITRAQ